MASVVAAAALIAGTAAAQGGSKADEAWAAFTRWNYGEALGLAQTACAEGDLQGCYLVGRVLERSDTGMVPDLPGAVAHYKRACDGGNMNGCSGLGFLHIRGAGVAKDSARGFDLARRACDAGSMPGCNILGFAYERGEGANVDLLRAAGLFLKACDGGVAAACTNLGIFYRDGRGLVADAARAAALFKQACEGGSADGCASIGFQYETGKGVGADLLRAADFYRTACGGGSKFGCANLGALYLEGRGVAKDREQALLYALDAERLDPDWPNAKNLLKKINPAVPPSPAAAAVTAKPAERPARPAAPFPWKPETPALELAQKAAECRLPWDEALKALAVLPSDGESAFANTLRYKADGIRLFGLEIFGVNVDTESRLITSRGVIETDAGVKQDAPRKLTLNLGMPTFIDMDAGEKSEAQRMADLANLLGVPLSDVSKQMGRDIEAELKIESAGIFSSDYAEYRFNAIGKGKKDINHVELRDRSSLFYIDCDYIKDWQR